MATPNAKPLFLKILTVLLFIYALLVFLPFVLLMAQRTANGNFMISTKQLLSYIWIVLLGSYALYTATTLNKDLKHSRWFIVGLFGLAIAENLWYLISAPGLQTFVAFLLGGLWLGSLYWYLFVKQTVNRYYEAL